MNGPVADHPGAGGDGPPAVGDLSFAAASAELDGIVARLEDGKVDVDQLVRHLERAAAIVDELDRRIHATRIQVEQLLPRLAAAGDERAGPEEKRAGPEENGPGTPAPSLPPDPSP